MYLQFGVRQSICIFSYINRYQGKVPGSTTIVYPTWPYLQCARVLLLFFCSSVLLLPLREAPVRYSLVIRKGYYDSLLVIWYGFLWALYCWWTQSCISWYGIALVEYDKLCIYIYIIYFLEITVVLWLGQLFAGFCPSTWGAHTMVWNRQGASDDLGECLNDIIVSAHENPSSCLTRTIYWECVEVYMSSVPYNHPYINVILSSGSLPMSNIDAELLGFTWCGCFLCCTNIHGDGSNIRVEYRLITKPEEFELNLNGDFMDHQHQ